MDSLETWDQRDSAYLLRVRNCSDEVLSNALSFVWDQLGKGYKIKIYDDKVELSRLIGANKAFLESELPHIASLMCSSMEELISHSDVVVIANGSKVFKQTPELMNKQQILIDLVGVAKEGRNLPGAYEGMGW